MLRRRRSRRRASVARRDAVRAVLARLLERRRRARRGCRRSPSRPARRRASSASGRLQPARRQHDDVLRGEPRQHGGGEVLPELVHADAARLALRVDPSGAQRGEVIVAILHRHVVERRRSRPVGGADERVQGERGRSVAPREPIDELLEVARRWAPSSGASADGGRVALASSSGSVRRQRHRRGRMRAGAAPQHARAARRSGRRATVRRGGTLSARVGVLGLEIEPRRELLVLHLERAARRPSRS